MKIGIGINEWAKNLPTALAEACADLNIQYELMDLANISEVEVTHLAPALLYMKPAAFNLYRKLEGAGVKTLNSVAAIEVADDKSLTYKKLMAANIAQLSTQIVDLSLEAMQKSFIAGGTVYKRTHGGQGRWVRLAKSTNEIEAIYNEFLTEGPGSILVQPFIEEANGQTIRVIVTGGRVLASARRTATMDFRSNISAGGVQEAIEITPAEEELAIVATSALGLGHAGVDLIRTNFGPAVLEVNACPDFTSMKEISEVNIAQEVIKTLLLK